MRGSVWHRIGIAVAVIAATPARGQGRGLVAAGPGAERTGWIRAGRVLRVRGLRLAGSGPPEARAREAVARARDLLGLRPGDALPAGVVARGRGTVHVRFPQTSGGVPVEDAEIRVHLDAAGRLTGIDSTWRPEIGPVPPPRIGLDDALRRARALAAAGPVEVRDAGLARTRCGELVRRVDVRTWRPPRLLRVAVDAHTGAIVAARDLLRRRDGLGRIFLPNPVVALKDPTLRDAGDADDAVPEEAYRNVVLQDLDVTGVLSGPFATTRGTPDRAREPDFHFLYTRSDPRFEEVMAYYHVDAVARFLHEIGFTNLASRPIELYANAQPPGIPFHDDMSYFQPMATGPGAIAFGTGGVDDAEDAEIIVHEFGHALQHEQVPYFGLSAEAEAIGEGFCDFLATAFLAPWSDGFGDDCVADWDARGYEEPRSCLRAIPEFLRYPDDLQYDAHADGRIWSSALWAVLREVGREDAIALAVEANFFLDASARFVDTGQALLEADEALSEGMHAAALRGILAARGLLAPPLRLEGFVLADGLPLRIPDDDGEGVRSRLVWGGEETITSGASLLVYVDIEHEFPPDLLVTITAPDGSRYRLTPPAHFPAIFGAPMAPRDSFAPLAGQPARGTWTLRAVDLYAEDTGTLQRWGIRIVNWVRGEVNGDGQIDVADAVAILSYLFADGSLPCRTPADINDDGTLDLADPIRLLSYLFDHGPAPPEPFERPGADPTPDTLPCPGA